MIGFLLQLTIILIIILILIRPSIGICLYIAYFFLVPSMGLSMLGLDSTETTVLIAFCFIATILGNKYKIKKIDYSPLIPFFILYSVLFCLTFFSSQLVPLFFSTKDFIRYSFQTFIIPTCIYTLISCKPVMLKEVNKTMIVVITIIVVYGLFLTLIPGTNPYIEFLSDEINLLEYRKGTDDGRLFGAISSVFNHPMSYGIFLGFAFFYIIYSYKYIGQKSSTFLFLISLVFLSTLLCGVRSSLASLIGTGFVYLLLKRKVKLLIKAAFLGGIVLYVISLIPELNAYVGSMFQMDSDDVSGSSINQRLAQLEASVFEIRNNLLFGNGYAWHSYYLYMNDLAHPLLHGWESLLFVAITDSGFIGVGVWIVFSIYYCLKIKDIELICLFSYFMFYRLITGTFGEEMFYVFYALILCARNNYPIIHKRTLIRTII